MLGVKNVPDSIAQAVQGSSRSTTNSSEVAKQMEMRGTLTLFYPELTGVSALLVLNSRSKQRMSN
jgi:hypothetical protein